jgi:hypothetical protein
VASSYLERYRAGEYEAVWAELTALGPAVREAPLYVEAQAVARETMTRARSNVETLVERLKTLGYRFHNEISWQPPDDELLADLRAIEAEHGTLPLSLETWYEVVGTVNFMGSHPHLSAYAAAVDLRQVDMYFQGKLLRASIYPDFHIITSHDDLDVQRRVRPPDGDPLVVDPCHESMVWPLDEQGLEDLDPELRYGIVLAPDSIHKSNESGGDPTQIYFPSPAMDAPLRGDWEGTLFVPYLRVCFAWGGFPGLRAQPEPPREELAFLTADLLPI